MQQGVYLFLGYSEKDESLLKKVTNQGAIDALGAIQGLVSYHNVNANKVSTPCTRFDLIKIKIELNGRHSLQVYKYYSTSNSIKIDPC